MVVVNRRDFIHSVAGLAAAGLLPDFGFTASGAEPTDAAVPPSCGLV